MEGGAPGRKLWTEPKYEVMVLTSGEGKDSNPLIWSPYFYPCSLSVAFNSAARRIDPLTLISEQDQRSHKIHT